MDDNIDFEVGRFALRTFLMYNGKPESLCANTLGRGNWVQGVCEANCYSHLFERGRYPRPSMRYVRSRLTGRIIDVVCEPSEPKPNNHPAPDISCTCGIYGSLSLEHLQGQYRGARDLVAVIAAEGNTVVGTHGLRTERARVVAFWQRYETPGEGTPLGELFVSSSFSVLDRKPPDPYSYSSCRPLGLIKRNPQPVGGAVERYFPGAQRFDCCEEMVAKYGLDVDAPAGTARNPFTSQVDFWREGEKKT